MLGLNETEERVRAMLETGNDQAAALLQLVRELTVELHPGQAIAERATLDSALEKDLGIDSLARVELLTRVERAFGVTVPEQRFANAETPRDLVVALRQARAGPSPSREALLLAAGSEQTAEVPHQAQTLVDVLDWHVRAHPDRPHIRIYEDEGNGQTLSYGQLREQAGSVAAGLQARGLLPGEAVAIMLPTGADYFRSFYGILLGGGIPVPIYPPARPAQLEEHLRRERGVLANCLAAMLITVPEAKPVAHLLRSQVESLRHIVTVEDLMSSGGAFQAAVLRAEDIAFLQYTSGSTGNPKGVVLTHANLLANIRADGQAIRAAARDVFVSWLPLYHDMGLIGAWLGSLYHAVLLVVMSPLAFLARPRRWFWAIHQHRGTLSAAPNFAYELCLSRIADDELEGLDLSSWRIAFNGAEAVSPDTVTRFGERFARWGFDPSHMYPVYGLAECSVGLAFPPLGRGPLVDTIAREPFTRAGQARPARAGSSGVLRFVASGRPLPGHEIRIVDAAGAELPERQEGRLQFKGPSATSGYYRNPEATRRLFQGDWLESGDRAYMADGDVYITGRDKDVIIRAGRNVYPQELEEAVGELVGIRRGRVVAFGSSEAASGTERLVVMAETREKDTEQRDGLRSAVMRLTSDLIGMPPDEVVLAPPGTVLKTSSGKLRRAASRELYEQGRVGRGGRAVWWQVARLLAGSLGPALRRGLRAAAGAGYAGYAWVVFGMLSLISAVALLVVPRAPWRWAALRTGARLLVRATATRTVVSGLEHLPRDGSCVLVANHASYLDGYVLVAALPLRFRFVAKRELARQPLVGLALRRMGTEFVDRLDKQQSVADADRIAMAARAGSSLLFFPEGTFSRMPGLLPFRMGAFLTAVQANLAVLPVAVTGTRSILRAGSWWPRRGSVRVTVGKPVLAEAGSEAWPAAVQLRNAAREHIQRHCGEPDLATEDRPSLATDN